MKKIIIGGFDAPDHRETITLETKRAKNPCAKTRKVNDPYEIWAAQGWEWHVLKKWQADDNKPYARWFCLVKSPIVPHGEMGDVYVSDIVSCARRIK